MEILKENVDLSTQLLQITAVSLLTRSVDKVISYRVFLLDTRSHLGPVDIKTGSFQSDPYSDAVHFIQRRAEVLLTVAHLWMRVNICTKKRGSSHTQRSRPLSRMLTSHPTAACEVSTLGGKTVEGSEFTKRRSCIKSIKKICLFGKCLLCTGKFMDAPGFPTFASWLPFLEA